MILRKNFRKEEDFHGRWVTNYNIPMVNGLIAILLLSLGACIMVEILYQIAGAVQYHWGFIRHIFP